MIKPLVSICVITYNHEPFIRKTLDGILMQQLNSAMEVVIGEDCSSDNTRIICEEYAKTYKEIIRLLPSERNLGMNNNFIRTLQACHCDYIALCEGDDYWTDPLKLKMQLKFLNEHLNCSACFTNAEIVDQSENLLRRHTNGRKEGYVSSEVAILRGGALYPTASLVFHGNPYIYDVLKSVDELAGDNLLIIILSMLGDVYYLDQITCAYRVWSGGVYSSVMYDKKETLNRKRRTVAGLKKLLKISKNPYKRYIKARISAESLVLLENDLKLKNFHYLFYLSIRDSIRLLVSLSG